MTKYSEVSIDGYEDCLFNLKDLTELLIVSISNVFCDFRKFFAMPPSQSSKSSWLLSYNQLWNDEENSSDC